MIKYKSGNTPNQRLKMEYMFNQLPGVARWYSQSPIKEDQAICMGNVRVFIHLLKKAFYCFEYTATAEQIIFKFNVNKL